MNRNSAINSIQFEQSDTYVEKIRINSNELYGYGNIPHQSSSRNRIIDSLLFTNGEIVLNTKILTEMISFIFSLRTEVLSF